MPNHGVKECPFYGETIKAKANVFLIETEAIQISL